jgi:hypothetical protein
METALEDVSVNKPEEVGEQDGGVAGDYVSYGHGS